MNKNRLTLNVLDSISKKISESNSLNSNNKVLILITGSFFELDEKIKELKKLKENSIDISLGFSFMAERILDINNIINSLNPSKVYREEDIFNIHNIIKDYSKIVVPNITINTISKVSLGMVDSFVSNLIWSCLYMNKEVYIDFTSLKTYMGEPCKNEEINTMIDDYTSKVKEMGGLEIEKGNYLEKIFYEENTHGKIDNLSKVITERDIMSYSDINKFILVPKGTILTPLAKDRAKERGIEIKIET
jgi:hypothetical protein